MATLTLRTTKGSPLTNAEVDGNFTALNTEVGTKLDSASYTATDVLDKIKTVDGTGSGLDADTLDGLNSATANTVSTIVARDSSGNFSAGTITATGFSGPLTGDVTGNVSGSAASLSATLVVASGGTGRTSLTENNVVLGNGTSAVNFVAPGSSGNVLVSNGTTWTSAAPTSSGISTGKSIAMAIVFGF
jgi:hypothetical protein